MEITTLEQAMAVINLLVQQRESISNSYVLQVADTQKLVTVCQEQAKEIEELKNKLQQYEQEKTTVKPKK